MNIKLSLTALKELHQNIGGDNAGFYIVVSGRSITDREQIIRADVVIATAHQANANWFYHLVKGKPVAKP